MLDRYSTKHIVANPHRVRMQELRADMEKVKLKQNQSNMSELQDEYHKEQLLAERWEQNPLYRAVVSNNAVQLPHRKEE